jgi:hypothetical protein
MHLDHLLGLLELGLGALGAPAQGGEPAPRRSGGLRPRRRPSAFRVASAWCARVSLPSLRAPARLAIGGALLSAIAARGILRRAE